MNSTITSIDAKIAASELRIARLERDAQDAEPGDDYDYAINQEHQYLQGLYWGRERAALNYNTLS